MDLDDFFNAREALIENPPPKCRYFSLPDVRNFPPIIRPVKKPTYNSILALWSQSNKMTEENTTEFILQLLVHSNWEPDFEAVAESWQVRGTGAIKARLRSIVESKGYKLGDDLQITGGERPKAAPFPPSKSQKPRKRKKTNDGADADETKAKKPKKANEEPENGVSSAKNPNLPKWRANDEDPRGKKENVGEPIGDNNSTDTGQQKPTGS